MTNSQEHITTELKKSLEEMIILPSKNLTNLIFIIIGIIAAKSVTLSNIAMVDGHHRLKAAKTLGLTEVPIEEVQFPYLGYETIQDLLTWGD